MGNLAAPVLGLIEAVDGLLAQQLGHILVGALLVAAQVEEGVRIADNPLPVVFEQGLQLGDILQKLLEEVLEEPQRNTKEFLLEEARRIHVKGSF